MDDGVGAGEAAGAALSGLPLSGGRGSVSPAAGALSADWAVSSAGAADRVGTGAGVGTAGTGVGLGAAAGVGVAADVGVDRKSVV